MNIISISFIFKTVGGVYVSINPPNTFSPSSGDSGMSRSSVFTGGDWRTCYTAQVTVASIDFTVKLDTGSSNFAIAGCQNLNGYSGPSVSTADCSNFILPYDWTTENYADNSSWSGYGRTLNVQLKGTNITALAPTYLIKNQTNFIDGTHGSGIMGLAFSSLASYQPAWSRFPQTIFDAWVQHNQIPNRISFHACPISLQSNSYVEFGSRNLYFSGGLGCSDDIGIVTMPMKTFITVDVNQILIDSTPITLPPDFQVGNETTRGSFSILDSCCSNILLPEVAYNTLVEKIKSSGAAIYFNDSRYDNFFTGSGYAWPSSSIDYSKLPTLGIDIKTRNSSLGYTTVTLTLNASQYIQYDGNGNLNFLVLNTKKNYATLGIPYFMAYHIDIDRDLGTLRFQQGCGCTSANMYPMIKTTNVDVNDTAVPSSAIRSQFSSCKHNILYFLTLQCSLASHNDYST